MTMTTINGATKTKAISGRLGEIESRVNDLMDEYRGLISRGAAVAKELGELLLEARSLVTPRHHWSKWLAAKCDMTAGTANRYMTIASGWGKVESHPRFPRLNVTQMHDVARDRPPRERKHSFRDQSWDVLLDTLDRKITDELERCPELKIVQDAIDRVIPALLKGGLLQREVEARKKNERQRRRTNCLQRMENARQNYIES